jgi:hypothetical protein
MPHSYVPGNDSDRDRVRFYLNDTEFEAGPLPGDANFDDHEIDDMLIQEGNWRRAVAAGLERLAQAWMRHPTFQADGISISRSHISRNYAEQAELWRRRYGFNAAARTSPVIRVDAYSDDIDSHEVSD